MKYIQKKTFSSEKVNSKVIKMSSLDNTTIEIRTIDESEHHILPHQQIVQIEG